MRADDTKPRTAKATTVAPASAANDHKFKEMPDDAGKGHVSYVRLPTPKPCFHDNSSSLIYE